MFNFGRGKTARQLADEGMKEAADHAEAVQDGWGKTALDYVRRYASEHLLFMGEDVRSWAHSNGLPVPPSLRAWGSVITTAKRDGIIEKKPDHYALTKIPPAHSTPRAVHRSRIYGGVEIVS